MDYNGDSNYGDPIYVVLFFVAAWIIYKVIKRLIYGDKAATENKKALLAWVVGLSLIGGFLYYQHLTTLPSGKYFIYVSSNDKTTVNYKLPADIDFVEGRYYVSKFYFPNGGSISFGEDFYSEFGKKTMLIDDNGKDWFVELTKEKVADKK